MKIANAILNIASNSINVKKYIVVAVKVAVNNNCALHFLRM